MPPFLRTILMYSRMRVECDNEARFATIGDDARDIFRQKPITDVRYTVE